jgi:hypothetical protein
MSDDTNYRPLPNSRLPEHERRYPPARKWSQPLQPFNELIEQHGKARGPFDLDRKHPYAAG